MVDIDLICLARNATSTCLGRESIGVCRAINKHRNYARGRLMMGEGDGGEGEEGRGERGRASAKRGERWRGERES